MTQPITITRGPAIRRATPLLLIPGILIVTCFFIVPIVVVTWRSFTDPEPGLQNYEWLAQNEVFLQVLLRTFIVSTVVTAVCVLIAYPYAYLMTIVGPTMQKLLLLFVLMPLWTSILVRTLAWMVLLQDSGPINDILELVGIGRQPLIRTTFGVGLGMLQVLLPFMVLPLYSAMLSIDTRLVPAARSLGANPVTAFLRVYLPLSLPGVAAGATTVFILGLGFYIVPALLGSPQTTMLSALIYQQFSAFLDWGHGSAMGVALLLLTAGLLGGLALLAGRTRRRSTGSEQ
ncbi:Spermidine Putrescine ABC transporter permease component PotB (TC 3.A.1.11.1) [Leucobacter sp. 7(1)]|uniref:ABC transporter permease n=1 Tax=Leucobacter sp. 7(1) TaxID=1255613 RepID=UPI00097EB5C4|nr:ABC transporter permease [Leucobacter sp. 7(1)]SJN10516.1 Spermidine Putrescine ABC transporter permease component PotB (TC 3.A.1.11.1) [Leucobacter sp. 7(1)]